MIDLGRVRPGRSGPMRQTAAAKRPVATAGYLGFAPNA